MDNRGEIFKKEGMTNYLLVYYGGKPAAPNERQKVMDDWMNWFKSLGQAVVDVGNPTKPGKMVSSKGVKDGVKGDIVTGYSILKADSMNAVVEMAKKSPQLAAGGQIAIYEVMSMM